MGSRRRVPGRLAPGTGRGSLDGPSAAKTYTAASTRRRFTSVPARASLQEVAMATWEMVPPRDGPPHIGAYDGEERRRGHDQRGSQEPEHPSPRRRSVSRAGRPRPTRGPWLPQEVDEAVAREEGNEQPAERCGHGIYSCCGRAGDTLLLAPGELVGPVAQAVPDPQRVHHGVEPGDVSFTPAMSTGRVMFSRAVRVGARL